MHSFIAIFYILFDHVWFTGSGRNMSLWIWLVFIGFAVLDALVSHKIERDIRIGGKPLPYTVKRSVLLNIASAIVLVGYSALRAEHASSIIWVSYVIAACIVIPFIGMKPMFKALYRAVKA